MSSYIQNKLASMNSPRGVLETWKLKENYLNGVLDRAEITDPVRRKHYVDKYLGIAPAVTTKRKEIGGWADNTWERTKLQTKLLGNQMREYWNAQTVVGDFDEDDYLTAKGKADQLVKELQSIPQDEGVGNWTQEFKSKLPTLGGNLGVSLGVGGAGAKAGTAAGVAVAPLLGPFAAAGPVIGAGVGFASGILAGLGLDSYMEGSVAFDDAQRNKEVQERVRARYGDNPDLLAQATRGVGLEVAGNVLQKNLMNPVNALVAVPLLKVPGKLGKSFLFRTGGLKYPNKLARTKATAMGAGGEFIQEASQEGIQEWELGNVLNRLDDDLGRPRKEQSTWERVQDLNWEQMLYSGSLGAFGGGAFTGLQAHLRQSKESPKEQIRSHVREAIESGDMVAFEKMRNTYTDLEKQATEHAEAAGTVGEKAEAQKQLSVITNARKTAFQEIADIQDGVVTDPRIDKDKTRYHMRVELLSAMQGGKGDVEAWIRKYEESSNPLAQQVVSRFLESERTESLNKAQQNLRERAEQAQTTEREAAIQQHEAVTPKRPLTGRLTPEAEPTVGLSEVLQSAISEKINKGRPLSPEEISYLNRTETQRQKLQKKSAFKPLKFKEEKPTVEDVQPQPEVRPPKRKSAYASDPRNVEVLARKVVKKAEQGVSYDMTEDEKQLAKNFPAEYETAVQGRYDRFQPKTKPTEKVKPTEEAPKAKPPKEKKVKKEAPKVEAPKIKGPVKIRMKTSKGIVESTELEEGTQPDDLAEYVGGLETTEAQPTTEPIQQPTKKPTAKKKAPKKKEKPPSKLPTPVSERTDAERVEKGTVSDIKEVITRLKSEKGEPALTPKEKRLRKSELQEMANALIASPKEKAVTKKKPSAKKKALPKAKAKKRLTPKSEEAPVLAAPIEQTRPRTDKEKSEAELMSEARELFGEPTQRMDPTKDEIKTMLRYALRPDEHDAFTKTLGASDLADHEIRFEQALPDVIEALSAYSVMLPFKGERLANVDSALQRAGQKKLLPREKAIWMSIAGENLRGDFAMLTDIDGLSFHPMRRPNRTVGYGVRDRFGNPVIDYIEYQNDVKDKKVDPNDAISEKYWVKVNPGFIDRYRIYASDPKVILKKTEGGYLQIPKAEIDKAKGVELDADGNPDIFDEIVLSMSVREAVVTAPREFTGDKVQRSKAFEDLIALNFAEGNVASKKAFFNRVDKVEKGVWDSTKIDVPNLEEATTPGREELMRGAVSEMIVESPKGSALESHRKTFKPNLNGKLELRNAIGKMTRRLPDKYTVEGMENLKEDQLKRKYLGVFINSQREEFGGDILSESELNETSLSDLRESAVALMEEAPDKVIRKGEEVTHKDVDSAVAEFLAKGGEIQQVTSEDIKTTPTVKETFDSRDDAVNDFIGMLTDGRLESIWVAPDESTGSPIINAIFKGDENTKPFVKLRLKDTNFENAINFVEGLAPTKQKDVLRDTPLFKLSEGGLRGGRRKTGMSYADARLSIDSFRKEFAGAESVDYMLYANPNEAKSAGWDVDQRAVGAAIDVEDGFGRPKILVFHDRLNNADDARALLFHESIVLFGMRRTMGEGAFSRMISDIVKYRFDDVKKKAISIRPTGLMQSYLRAAEAPSAFEMRIAAEEMLADLAEGRANPTLASKITHTIKSFFSRLFGRNMTDSQMRDLVIAAEKKFRAGALRNPHPAQRDSRPSVRPPQDNTPADVKRIRYSLTDDLPHLTSRREEADDLSTAPSWMNEEQKRFYIKMGPPHKGGILEKQLEYLKTDIWTKIRQGVFDRYASVLDRAGEKAYVLSRMASSSEGAFGALFTSGGIKLDKDGAIDVDRSKKSLVESLKPLGGELDTFLRWVGAKRAAQLKTEGRDALRFLTDEEITAGLTLNQGQTLNTVTGVNMSREQLFNDVHADLKAVQNSVLDIAVQTGAISQQMRSEWDEKFYVPFYRVIEEDRSGNNGPKTIDKMVNLEAFRRLEGSERGLGDLLQNTMMNLHHLIDVSLKNQAAVETVDALVQKDLALELGAYPVNKKEVIEFKKRVKDGDLSAAKQLLESDAKTIYVRKNGARVYYRIYDPLVLESLMSMNSVRKDNPLYKFFRGSKRWYTQAVTLSPEFRLANLMRDTISTMALAPVGMKDMTQFNPIFNVVRGYKEAGEKSKTYGSALAGGGMFRFGHSIGTDPDRARLMIEKGIKREFVLDNAEGFANYKNKVKETLKKGYQWYEGVGDRVESANRIALYNHLKKQGKSHLEASYEARDLMDFSLHGSWGAVQTLGEWSPFLNARLQGLYKLGRAGFTPGRRVQFATVTMGYVAASILNHLAWAEDDDYKDREEWDRDTYHWFKVGDTAFRIPKAFELGAIATLAERVVDQMVDDEAHGKLFRERLWHTLHETFAIDPLPMPLRPVLDIYSNRNPFTDRPIESMGMQRLSPQERKGSYTSETATLLSQMNAKAVPWEKVQYSPVQIEYAVKGYAAWIGGTVLSGVDSIIRMISGNERPEDGMNSIPVIGGALQKGARRFVVNLEDKKHTKYTTMFYEQLKEMNQVFADIREMRKLGDLERARGTIEENRLLLRYRTSYNRLARRLTKINNVIKRVTNDPRMDGQMKRQRLNRLQQLKNQLTRNLVGRSLPVLRGAA